MKTFQITLDNEFEADVLVSMFEQEKIPHSVVSHHSSAYDGLFQMTLGWGHLEIPEEYRQKSEALLEDYRNLQNI